jgi:hypothetical protein
VAKLSRDKAKKGSLYAAKSRAVKEAGKSALKAAAGSIKVGEVLQSFTADGQPTKVRVVAKRKIDLDRYVI